MSIYDAIKARVGDGSLFLHRPQIVGIREPRHLFLPGNIYEIVTPAHWDTLDENDENLERLPQLRADFDLFSNGEDVRVSEDPRGKPSDTQLARTDPTSDEIWDIRSWLGGNENEPGSGIRVLGRFAAKSTFVALCWEYRESLNSEAEWQEFITSAIHKWRELFPFHDPLKGRPVHEYGPGLIRVRT